MINIHISLLHCHILEFKELRYVLFMGPTTYGIPHGHSVDIANDVLSGYSHTADS